MNDCSSAVGRGQTSVGETTAEIRPEVAVDGEGPGRRLKKTIGAGREAAASGVQAVGRMMRSHEPRTSELLTAMVAEGRPDQLTVQDALSALGSRAYGMSLLLFSLINFLPLPTPVTSLFALPILVIAGQMVIGRERLWLPRMFRERRVSRSALSSVVGYVVPWIRWLESISRPRLEGLAEGVATRLLGPVVAALALIVLLPLPLTNLVPSISIVLVALGLVERDGLAVIAGTGLGAGYLVLFITAADVIIKTAYWVSGAMASFVGF